MREVQEGMQGTCTFAFLTLLRLTVRGRTRAVVNVKVLTGGVVGEFVDLPYRGQDRPQQQRQREHC